MPDLISLQQAMIAASNAYNSIYSQYMDAVDNDDDDAIRILEPQVTDAKNRLNVANAQFLNANAAALAATPPPAGNEAEFGMVEPWVTAGMTEAEYNALLKAVDINLTPGGGAGGTYTPPEIGGTDMANGLGPLRERYTPEEMYRQGMGIPQQGYMNPWQKYLMNRYEPVSYLNRLQQSIGGALGQPPATPYEDIYAQNLPIGGRYAEAGNLWSQLGGMTGTQRETAGIGAEDYANILGMAMRPTYGRYGAQIAQQAVPGYQQEYERISREQGAAPAPTFLDYLRMKYNL